MTHHGVHAGAGGEGREVELLAPGLGVGGALGGHEHDELVPADLPGDRLIVREEFFDRNASGLPLVAGSIVGTASARREAIDSPAAWCALNLK